jgi:hypothetical protein
VYTKNNIRRELLQLFVFKTPGKYTPAVTAEKKIIILNNKFFPAPPETDLENINLIIYFQELGSEPQVTEIDITKVLNKIKI